ncbi:MAG: hypothetical protein ABI981_00120 [Betaproteobacteria bacterium]
MRSGALARSRHALPDAADASARAAVGDAAAGSPPGAGTQLDETAQRVVRDSFTMPLADYALIGSLKVKCLGMGIAVKKSELLRAGLHALTRISDQNFAEVVSAVESVKTGRPPGKKRKKSKRAKITR